MSIDGGPRVQQPDAEATPVAVDRPARRAASNLETIVASFDVPFDFPRSPDLRFDADFAALAGEVSHALRGSHA